MPLDLVPEPLRPWIADVSERANLNPEMIAVPAVIALGATVGRKVGIHPKQFDTWLEVPNLWGALVAPPSSRKTFAISEGTRPLKHIAERDRKAYEQAQGERDVDRTILEMEIEKLKKEARTKGGSPGIKAALQEKEAAIKELDVPEPRRIINDATVEKIGELLKNPNGLLTIRDELEGLLSSYNKPGREGDRAFYLEGWNGKGGFTYDRISRDTLHLPALTLSIVGGIQPGKLDRHVRGALAGSSEADGLLQRFQLLVMPEGQPHFALVDRLPNMDALERAFAVFEWLDALDPVDLDAEINSYDSNNIPGLRFCEEAQVLFNGWYTELMLEVASPELANAPAYQAHLAKYASLMPKLALLFHLINVADGKASGPVSRSSAEGAVRWCAFLKEHAKKLYAAELARGTNSALALAEKVLEEDVRDGVNVRDIYRKRWPGLKSADAVREAAATLAASDWARLEEVPNEGTKPSEVIRINPRLLDG